MQEDLPSQRLLMVLISTAILCAIVILPGPANASMAWGDDTYVAITHVIKYPEGTTSSSERAPTYHDLSVEPIAWVTFRNIATYDDIRTDRIERKLEVWISAGSFEGDHITIE